MSTNLTLADCSQWTGCQLKPHCVGVCEFATPTRFKPRAVENQFEADPKLIDHIERLLADAKSGKLRGLGLALVNHDGLVPAGEVSWWFYATRGTSYVLGEAISRLRHAWDKERDG